MSSLLDNALEAALGADDLVGAGGCRDPRRRPAPPQRPRRRPDRPDRRGHRPRGRGRRGLHDRDRPRPRRRAGRGRRLPRRPHAADGARRRGGHRPGREGRSPPASRLKVDVSDALLGRALDGLGRPLDGLGPMPGTQWRPAEAAPPDPLSRPRIDERVSLGVRALDAMVPCGRGQRLGIFAGSGVGKSSLLGMIARSSSAEINVICLVGERGREVLEFMERDLGPEGLARSVVVVRDLRPARARAPEGRLHGDGDRGVLPRPGPRRDADDGLGHPLRHGPARGRPGHRRAAGHARLHAERVRHAAEAARALGHLPGRLDHRALHRARRRRRHERADRRRRARHPRRPHRALPPPGARRALPGGRRARLRLPPRRRDRLAARCARPATPSAA